MTELTIFLGLHSLRMVLFLLRHIVVTLLALGACSRTTSTSSVFICMVFYAARNVYPSSFSGIKKRPNFHVARQSYHRAGVQVKPFSLKYKEFHRFRTDVSSAQTRFCFAAFRFRDVAPVQEDRRRPLCAGTTCLLLSSCTLSTSIKSSHNHRGYPPHCRSYIR